MLSFVTAHKEMFEAMGIVECVVPGRKRVFDNFCSLTSTASVLWRELRQKCCDIAAVADSDKVVEFIKCCNIYFLAMKEVCSLCFWTMENHRMDKLICWRTCKHTPPNKVFGILASK